MCGLHQINLFVQLVSSFFFQQRENSRVGLSRYGRSSESEPLKAEESGREASRSTAKVLLGSMMKIINFLLLFSFPFLFYYKLYAFHNRYLYWVAMVLWDHMFAKRHWLKDFLFLVSAGALFFMRITLLSRLSFLYNLSDCKTNFCLVIILSTMRASL